MHRIFLGLAVTSGTLLVVSLALGLVAAGQGGGTGHTWHDIHFLLGLLTVLAGLLVHSIVFTYFLGTGKWVKEVVRVYRLPDWIEAHVRPAGGDRPDFADKSFTKSYHYSLDSTYSRLSRFRNSRHRRHAPGARHGRSIS